MLFGADEGDLPVETLFPKGEGGAGAALPCPDDDDVRHGEILQASEMKTLPASTLTG